MQIKTPYNQFCQTTNSPISFWIARGEMNQDVVVMNGDDVFGVDVDECALGISV